MTPRSRSRKTKRGGTRPSRSQASRATPSPVRPLPGPPPSRRSASEQGPPAPSSRYTPSLPAFRIRPTSHKVLGWILVGLGVAVAIVNDVQWAGFTLLPGGHSELYLLLGAAVAVFGAWWLGLFDRPTSS